MDPMADRIDKRQSFTGTGMMNSPEYLDELEERRETHARLIRGKPERTFGDIFAEKLQGKPEESESEEEAPEEEEKGARDPYLGLAPGQDSSLAESGKGRRAGRVIVKG